MNFRKIKLPVYDWGRVLPEDLASMQESYDLRHAVKRYLQTEGATQRGAAERFGVSDSRIHQMKNNAERDERFNRRPPIERFLTERAMLNRPKRRRKDLFDFQCTITSEAP
jgi:hypothetical protein